MADEFYPVVVASVPASEGGGFVAYVPDLNGCTGDGDTPEAAVADVQNAMGEWIDAAIADGKTIPAPGSSIERARKERSKLLQTLRDQKEAIRKMEATIEELRSMLVDREEPSWALTTVAMATAKYIPQNH